MEHLTVIDKRAMNTKGDVGVIMRTVSGYAVDDEGVKFRYFEFVTQFMESPIRVEWDDTGMEAVLPKNMAEVLIKKGYARDMTSAEVRAYNSSLGPESEPEPAKKPEPAKEPDPSPAKGLEPVLKKEPDPSSTKTKKGEAR
jgi:hypothetical protein